MTTSESLSAKRRRVRKRSLAKLIRSTGRTDFTVEQEPDGTTRIIFGKPAKVMTVEANEWDS